jgi:CDGSH-type Zn-finger protein
MSEVTIKVRAHGPLLVTGPVTLIDAQGNRFALPQSDKPGVALCRCGQSGKRPFCDGAHARCGFAADDRAEP